MFVLRPLAQRSISLLWAGQVLAATGSEFYMVAVVWIAADFIGRDAGYVSALQSGALLFGSLFGGILTDRWRHSTTMISVDVLRAVLLLVLSVAGFMHFMSLPLLMVLAGCIALLTAAFDPSLQATLPTIAIDPDIRHATNGLFDATRRMARILGPSLIALVNGFLPKSQFFTVTAATFLLSALAVWMAVARLPSAPRRREFSGTAAVIDGVLGGWRMARGHAAILYGLFTNLMGNIAWAMGILLGMILHLRETSTDPLTDYSLMMTAYGVGNVTTNLILSNIKPRRPVVWIITAKLIFGAGVFLLPLMHDRLWLMVVACLAAINGPFENLAMLHLMQTRSEPHRLAQIYRLLMCAIFLGLFLAYLMSPSLFAWFGIGPSIMGAGAAVFVAGLIGIGLLAWRQSHPVDAKPA
ncbi:putative MFS family arabinose efflux permease [Rhizobium sp. BK313]|uniref:MFS transporter n=1 Tax=Rhizobium sp. BK313 TaxID=2587081 RepID=UPI00105E5EAB|nr:MFS transporter [Rhizobium sp. BK313]MBB3452200.1 putative MFS family arabinose efflux permease [Rhizobium sp. BK313]